MPNDIQEIKDRTNVVDLIGEYVKLNKMGSSHKGLCPFHNEKSPSFVVSEEKQIWHCFGCSKGGDIFTFIEEIESMDFKEALELLAKRAGVEIRRENPKQTKVKKTQRSLLDLTARFFEEGLKKSTSGEIAREYLKKRGMSEEAQQKFRIGYSPNSYSITSSFLMKKGFKMQDIAKAGLYIQKPDRSGYDRFRHRLMFPIFDIHSSVVGFGARLLEKNDKAPKYLNSPETELYNKSNILYGLNFAKKQTRDKDFIILVEGYMDVISSHEAGVQNVVAASGTALTEGQLGLIARFTKNLYLSFDMDQAGQGATRRSVELALEKGFSIKIIAIEDGKDPDELIKSGVEKWEMAIERAQHICDHYLEKSMKEFQKENVEDKKRVFSEVVPLLAKLQDPVELSHYSKKLAESIEMPESIIEKEVQKLQGGQQKTQQREVIPIKQKSPPTPVRKSADAIAAGYILAIMVEHPKFITNLKNKWLFTFFDEKEKILAKALVIGYNKAKKGSIRPKDIIRYIEAKKPEIATMAKQLVLKCEHDMPSLAEESNLVQIEEFFEANMHALKKRALRKRIEQISEEMRVAEAENQLEKIEKLSKQFNILSKQLLQKSE